MAAVPGKSCALAVPANAATPPVATTSADLFMKTSRLRTARISLAPCFLGYFSCSTRLDQPHSTLAHFAKQEVVVIVLCDLRIEEHFLHVGVVALLCLLEERVLFGDLVQMVLRGLIAGLHDRLRERAQFRAAGDEPL